MDHCSDTTEQQRSDSMASSPRSSLTSVEEEQQGNTTDVTEKASVTVRAESKSPKSRPSMSPRSSFGSDKKSHDRHQYELRQQRKAKKLAERAESASESLFVEVGDLVRCNTPDEEGVIKTEDVTVPKKQETEEGDFYERLDAVLKLWLKKMARSCFEATRQPDTDGLGIYLPPLSASTLLHLDLIEFFQAPLDNEMRTLVRARLHEKFGPYAWAMLDMHGGSDFVQHKPEPNPEPKPVIKAPSTWVQQPVKQLNVVKPATVPPSPMPWNAIPLWYRTLPKLHIPPPPPVIRADSIWQAGKPLSFNPPWSPFDSITTLTQDSKLSWLQPELDEVVARGTAHTNYGAIGEYEEVEYEEVEQPYYDRIFYMLKRTGGKRFQDYQDTHWLTWY